MSKRYVLLGMTLTLAIALAVPAMGGPSNPIANAAASAKSTAKKALKRAKKANKNAKAAQASADQANAAAGAANTAANGAKATADSAAAAAAAAQSTADQANSAAGEAKSAADQAKAAADAAQATADSKLGSTYIVEGENVAGNTSAIAGAGCGIDNTDPATGGGYILNGAGNNDVTVTMSTAYANGWLVRADEIGGGTADAWNLTATVYCADPAVRVIEE